MRRGKSGKCIDLYLIVKRCNCKDERKYRVKVWKEKR